jgi:glycosyltransferase involved in cell wall biosynthesis
MSLLTVVIPTYNSGAYLQTTLDSVAAQSRGDLTVVVVDDGSTDGSADRAEAHPIVARVLRQPNLGVAVARNRGCATATTEWVTFLDQDDVWHRSRWQRAADYLDSHEHCDALVTTEQAFSVVEDMERLQAADSAATQWASRHIPAGSEMRLLCEADEAANGSGRDEVLAVDDVLANTVTVTTSFFARRDRLFAAGLFAPHARAHDDYVLLCNLARLTSLVKVDQPTLFYRVHADATSRSTRLALPFLSTCAALRNGDVLLQAGATLERSDQPLVRHLMLEHLEDPLARRPLSECLALVELLRLDTSTRNSLRRMVVRRALTQHLGASDHTRGILGRIRRMRA